MCGVMCGLSIVMMLSGSIIPFATFCAPAIGGILLMPVAVECGMKLAWVCYGAVAALSLLFVPDKEMAAIFVFLLGYYPLLKAYIERAKRRPVRFVVKAAVFNGAVFAMYGALLYLFPLQYIVQEFASTAKPMLALLILLGNLCFWIYDAALANILQLYVIKLKPKLAHIL
mgnify:FL=1